MDTSLTCTERRYVCAGEKIKLIGSVNGMFPDFGHHLENEMGGLWMHPVKLLDGFWLRFCDHTAKTVDCWVRADRFENLPYGNRFAYGSGLGHTEVSIERFQYVPEGTAGLSVAYTFYNRGSTPRSLTAEFLARADLRPVWFSETVGLEPGARDEAEWLEGRAACHITDCDHPWHVVFGADAVPSAHAEGALAGPENTRGKNAAGSLTFDFALAPGEERSLRFFVAGSLSSLEDCLAEYSRLADPALLQAKKERCRALERLSSLETDDAAFDEIFRWVKYDTDWLVADAGPAGRGLAAGLPEYPWWFGCDSCYALQGMLATGRFELCRDTLSLLLSYSERFNGDGRILHEVTTAGAVPNYGNTQETAQFVTAVYRYFEWTGDRAFLERCAPYLRKSVEWLRRADTDGDLFPSGYGITEIAGLNLEMIDSAVYTWEAYAAWAEICRLLGAPEEAERAGALAERLRGALEAAFWNEDEQLYCDCVASAEEVEKNLEGICDHMPPKRAEALTASLRERLERLRGVPGEKGWLLHKNWVIATPMETGLSPAGRAGAALRRMDTDEFVGPYGMYLSALSDAAMTISTGVLAVAQARYGYADRALALLTRMFRSFSMATPGSISEMSPDYGCFAQAWTAYAAFVPVVEYFFGIRPRASENTVRFGPRMPSRWNRAALRGVRLPGGMLDVEFERRGETERYTLRNKGAAPLSVAPEGAESVLLAPGDAESWARGGDGRLSRAPG